MTYTIKINKTESRLAQNLLQYLKSLTKTKEYDFLQIVESEDDILTKEQKEELDNRYDHFLHKHKEYPAWEDVKHKYLKQ